MELLESHSEKTVSQIDSMESLESYSEKEVCQLEFMESLESNPFKTNIN